MGILGWVVPGLIVVAVALRALPPHRQPGGPPATLSLPLTGGLMAGAIASVAGLGEPTTFFTAGTWVAALAGALLTLAVLQVAALR